MVTEVTDPDHDSYWVNNVVANDKLITKTMKGISAATWAAAKKKYKNIEPPMDDDFVTGQSAMGVPRRDEET